MATKCIWEYSLKRQKAMDVFDGGRTTAPDDVNRFLRGIGLHEYEQERFLAIFLDTKHRIKGYSVVTIGLVDRTTVHPREVFRNAILQGATSVVVAHNHPSGDVTPSSQDIACTKNLAEAGKIIGIQVLDHVIVGDPVDGGRQYLSFKEEGLI